MPATIPAPSKTPFTRPALLALLTVVLAVVLNLLGRPAAAQPPQPGDLIVSNFMMQFGGVYAINWPANRVKPLRPVGSSFYLWAIMDLDNRSIVALDGSNLTRIAPDGTETAIATMPLPTFYIEPDEDGTYLVSGQIGTFPTRSIIYSVTNGSFTTFTTQGPQGIDPILIEPDTGDYILGAGGQLWRFTRTALFGTTLTPNLGPLSGLDTQPSTGDIIAVTAGLTRGAIVSPSGAVLTTFGTAIDYGVKVDDRTGHIFVADSTGVTEYSPTGVSIRTLRLPGVISSVDIYGSRNVSGFGIPRRGQPYGFLFAFPLAGPGASYVGALSLSGLRPGLQLPGGQTLHLNVDGLTLALLQSGDLPGITTGFRGTLDRQATASALVRIPPFVPAGTRVSCTAVAFTPNAPGGIEVGNTIGFTVQ